MNRLAYYTAAIFCVTALPLMSSDIAKNLKQKNLPLPVMSQKYASRYSEAVIPRLKNPDLKGNDNNWNQAYEVKRFTVTRNQAVNYAHALQGGGEWEQLLPQTLIPRNGTSVKLGYDDKYLYMQIKCYQKRLDELLKRSEKVKRDSTVYTNENLDILISANSSSNEYFQIMLDVKGSLYDAHKFRNSKNSGTEWNKDFYRHITYGKNFWMLTIALPVTEWGLSLKEGSFIDCNIGRVEIFNKEYSTLSPVDAAFNQSDRFCRLWIGRKSLLPAISALEMKNPLIGSNELLVTINNPADKTFSGTLKSDNDIQKISVAPRMSKTFKFIKKVEKTGPLFCQANLFNNNNECIDTAYSTAQVLPVMELKLNSKEYIANSGSIHAVVNINIPVDDAELDIVCGGKKERLKAASVTEFDFDVDTSSEKAEFKISLFKNKQLISSAKENITVSKDPFDE